MYAETKQEGGTSGPHTPNTIYTRTQKLKIYFIFLKCLNNDLKLLL